jgi:hypothetical protein
VVSIDVCSLGHTERSKLYHAFNCLERASIALDTLKTGGNVSILKNVATALPLGRVPLPLRQSGIFGVASLIQDVRKRMAGLYLLIMKK